VWISPEPLGHLQASGTDAAGRKQYLGNTPAVARASYVDPRVLDRFLEGETTRPALGSVSPEELSDPSMQLKVERAVLDLIESAPHRGERQAA